MKKKKEEMPKRRMGEEMLLCLLKEGLSLASDLLSLETTLGVKRILGLHKVYKEFYPFSVNKSFNRLWRKGLVKVSEVKDGYKVKLTEKGKTEYLRFNINVMKIPTPDHWDRRWRIVFFDIAEKHRKARDFLCRKLKEMNFFLMQKSVYVHPFPCQKEIKFLREVLGVPHEVKMGLLENLDNEEDLKKIFYPLLKEIS